MPIEFKKAPDEWNLDRTCQVAIAETRPQQSLSAFITDDTQPPEAFRVNTHNVFRTQYRVPNEILTQVSETVITQQAQAQMRYAFQQQYANATLGTTTSVTSTDLTGVLNYQAMTGTVYYQQQIQSTNTDHTDIRYNFVTVPSNGIQLNQQSQWYHVQDGLGQIQVGINNPNYAPDVKKTIREFMKTRWQIRSGSKALPGSVPPQEQKARDCLRDMISEADWRRYVTNGFIMVKGSRGWYQIFASKYERIRFFQNNKHLHNLCVHTDDSCPPSDHVVNMKIMVECNEDGLWNGEANVHAPVKSSLREQFFNPPTEQVSLVKTFKMYKNVA